MSTIDRILQLVKESGLTAKDFAIGAGIAGGSITDWKTGRSKPSVESLQKISKYANVQLKWLTGDTDFKTPKEEFDDFIQKENKLIILKTIDKYYYEYVPSCSLSENDINFIINLVSNVTSQNIEQSKAQKKAFIDSFPISCRDKIKEFLNIIIKEVINNLNNKQHYHYLISLIDKQTQDKSTFISIPIVGKIAAGQPILAQENIEGYLPLDPSIYGLTTSEDLFFLKVAGQSMNLKVKNGDYALIHKQNYAENGDIVVAIVNGDEEATLKRYKQLNEQFVLLEPMSTDTSIEPITIDLKNTEFHIIGKAIGQFGKF